MSKTADLEYTVEASDLGLQELTNWLRRQYGKQIEGGYVKGVKYGTLSITSKDGKLVAKVKAELVTAERTEQAK